MTYYTLLVWLDGAWKPQFGDYSRGVVVQEGKDSWPGHRKSVIRTEDTQAAIDARVKELNGQNVNDSHL